MRGEWTTNENGFTTAGQKLYEFFKINFGHLRLSEGRVVHTNVKDYSVNSGRQRVQQIREFFQDDWGCGSGKTMCYGIKEADMSYC